MFERINSLIGNDNLNKIKSKSVCIIGIGGVGGMALECLVRSGISEITIIDFDTFEPSNLNRQIISNINAIDQKKVKIAKERYLSINPNLKVNTLDIFLNENNIDKLSNYDYIIDACDSLKTKIDIIKFAKINNVKLISCMGMGNRIDPSLVNITKLNKTINDPLSKKLRYELRKENIDLDINVVSSSELPIKSEIVTSMIMVPATAGIYLANYIIDDIIKTK